MSMARIDPEDAAAHIVNLSLSNSPLASWIAQAASEALNQFTHTAIDSASHTSPPAVPAVAAVALNQARMLIYPDGGVRLQAAAAYAADAITVNAPTQSITATALGLPIASGHEPKISSPSTDVGGLVGRAGVDAATPSPAEQTPAPLGNIDLYPPHDPLTYTEFDKKYTPDRHGEEAQPNARVWRVYRDRVTELDEDLIQGWNSTLDVLLIFAGLFSAVATAFIIEAAKQLQHDYTQYTAVGVFAVLAALNTTTSVTSRQRLGRAARSRWINGLWFTSLTFALIDALLAILVKQWLVEYASKMRQSAGDAKRWAWRHFAFREGLSKWHVGLVISSLAVLLHVAMFLFLFWLLTFLFDLDQSICVAGAIFTGLAGSFYLAATLAPLLSVHDPAAEACTRCGALDLGHCTEDDLAYRLLRSIEVRAAASCI
ncbi:hypothetical protein BKA62DRAFT_663659 [Auriculariales sp. MPI-PUGE-AT-0066]|nr:hypothetical protein BKA62DRAFT_663659 [Auriculariales sp. MPI-PUGE-AT-0066]